MGAVSQRARAAVRRVSAGREAKRLLAADVDVAAVRTSCYFLGPYRNLTTLTAGTLALHPEVQVLNHGEARLDRVKGLDPLAPADDESYERFVRVALAMSGGGQRGDLGGSITHSHAFDHEAMATAYRDRYGDEVHKPNPTCLVWKESMRLTRRVRREGLDLGAVLSANPALRLLHPVRNPLDCAASNARTGHDAWLDLTDGQARHGSRRDLTLSDILDLVLDDLAWFADRRVEHPTRLFLLVEDHADRTAFADLARFLEVDEDERWLDDVEKVFTTGSSYDHPPQLVARYRDAVEARFAGHPELRSQLLGFAS